MSQIPNRCLFPQFGRDRRPLYPIPVGSPQQSGVHHIDGRGGARNAVVLSYAFVESCKVKRERTAKERKARNSNKRKNKQKRLKSAETLVPALSIGVRTAEEQNIALSAARRERDLRIDLLTRRLEVVEERAVGPNGQKLPSLMCGWSHAKHFNFPASDRLDSSSIARTQMTSGISGGHETAKCLYYYSVISVCAI